MMSKISCSAIDEIESIKERLGMLEDKQTVKKSREPARWRPLDTGCMSAMQFIYDRIYFADQHLIEFMLIKILARELNGGYGPNFENGTQKFVIGKIGDAWEDVAQPHNIDSAKYYFRNETARNKALKILNRGDIDKLVDEVC